MDAREVLRRNGDFSGSPLLDTARRLHACLSREGIPYVIIGGLAVVRNGAARTTVDVDVLLAKEDRDRARAALAGDFATELDRACDKRNKVEVDFLYSGDDWGMVLPLPAPAEHAEFDRSLGASFLSLRGILELKTAVYLHKKKEDGIEVAAKDLADVVALLRANPASVDAALLACLHPAIRRELRRILRRLGRRD
jgi:hypothetical protein